MDSQTPIKNNSLLHKAAGNLAFLLSAIRCGERLHDDEEKHVREIIDALTAADAATAWRSMESVSWNVGAKLLGRECTDHPAVRGTSYEEVYDLLGTSGCSRDAEMWDWSRLGVIETRRGRLVVYPGDRIIARSGEFYPLPPLPQEDLK